MDEKLKEIQILLVEDNPNDVEMILRSLDKHNLANKVQVAKDGEEALDYLFATGKFNNRHIEERPKLILLDLKLPKVHGLEVLKRVKADERTKYVPVVVLTSSKEDTDLRESYKLGANSYVMKPMEFDEFTRVVSGLGLYWLLVNKPPL